MMKNSNFDFFKKFIEANYNIKTNININWKKINDNLITIEEKLINNKEFEIIPIYGRKIVEQLLKYMCAWLNINDIGKNTQNLNEVFKDERISSFRKIKSSFRYIIENGNDTNHSYNYLLNKCEVTTITKDLRTCLLFFIEKILNIHDFNDYSDIPFDENIYYNRDNNNEIITKKEIYENHKIFEKNNDDINVNMIEIVSFLLGENRKFEIPMYQRGYDWDSDNINEFLNDILQRNKDKKTHYFGIIACKKDKINGDDVIKILDGQQRLTTSLIFIKALKDFYYYKFNKEIYKDNDYSQYQKFFYPTIDNKEIFFNEIIANITNSKDQNEKFNDILGQLSLNEIYEKYSKIDDNKKEYKVINSYFKIIDWLNDIFKQAIDNHEDIILEIALTFISKFEIGLIQFDEEKFKLKQELEIFENLNSKGKSLSVLDLVKNYLFSLCDEKILSNENDAEMINNWFKNKIVEEFNNEDESSEFLSSFVHLFSGEEQNAKKKSNFLKSFKKVIDDKIKWNLLIDNYNDKIEKIDTITFKSIIEIISMFISSYNKIKQIKTDGKEYEHIEHSLNLLIRTINKKKLTPLFAIDFLIIYFVIKTEKPNNKKLNQLLINHKKEIYKIHLIAIKYIIISYIRTGQGDSSLKRTIFKKCNEIIGLINQNSEIKSLDDVSRKLNELLFDEKISKEEMTELLDKGDDRIKTFNDTLFMLIEINRREKNHSKYPSELFVKNNHTIEHIMPKNPSKWENDIKEWNNISCSKNHKEFKQKHEEYVNKIGNLLLIAKGLNSSIKDDVFNKKLIWYDEFANELFLYKNENKKIDISKKNKWSFNEIDERTNEIKHHIIYEIFNDCLD